MTHQFGPIMMKWSIWVILEGFQTSLFVSSPFFNKLFRFLNIQHPVCNTGFLPTGRSQLAYAVVVKEDWSASMQRGVPKVFDIRGMEHFKHGSSARPLDP